MLQCPIDGSALEVVANALRCGQGHSFDRARDGYFNLLVVQHKASRDPGDSKEMVAARHRILDAGHYARIAQLTAQIAVGIVDANNREGGPSILDAGCGEGYYLDTLSRAFPVPVQCAGIDISKWAIRAAAKRNTNCFWAVASNRHLPFAPGSIDLILSMFGFPLWDAFAAIQPDQGFVLLVDPGPDHLIELRSIIYPSINPTEPPSLAAALSAGYRLENEQRLQFGIELTNAAQIADVLAMTPHNHRATAVGREDLALLDRLAVTGDVVFRVLRREGRQP